MSRLVRLSARGALHAAGIAPWSYQQCYAWRGTPAAARCSRAAMGPAAPLATAAPPLALLSALRRGVDAHSLRAGGDRVPAHVLGSLAVPAPPQPPPSAPLCFLACRRLRRLLLRRHLPPAPGLRLRHCDWCAPAGGGLARAPPRGAGAAGSRSRGTAAASTGRPLTPLKSAPACSLRRLLLRGHLIPGVAGLQVNFRGGVRMNVPPQPSCRRRPLAPRRTAIAAAAAAAAGTAPAAACSLGVRLAGAHPPGAPACPPAPQVWRHQADL